MREGAELLHCVCDKADRKHTTTRKRRQDSCRVQHVQPDACSSDCASTTARYLCSAQFFADQSMPTDVRAVTDANWAGELEALRSTSSGWIDFGGHLLETYSSTQQIVALSTAVSESISTTKGCSSRIGSPQCNGRMGLVAQSGV